MGTRGRTGFAFRETPFGRSMGPHDLNAGLISPSMAFHLDPPHIGQVILLPFFSEPNNFSLKLSKIS